MSGDGFEAPHRAAPPEYTPLVRAVTPSLRLAVGIVAALPAVAGGCTGTARGPNGTAAPGRAAEGVPGDFSLDLTVSQRGPAQRTALARCVVLPDGALHLAAADRSGATGLPPYRRTLSGPEVAALWSLLGELRLADPASAAPPAGPRHLEPGPGEALCVLAMSGAGQRWAHVWRVEAGLVPQQVDRLLSRLDALAWHVDPPPAPPVARIDFGPDPYARYRRP